MNPFDLRGPDFLLFYGLLAVATFGVLFAWRRMSEPPLPPGTWLRDPYLVAGLRGGSQEIIEVAILALLTRRVLSRAEGALVMLASEAGPAPSNDLERAVADAVADQPKTVAQIASDRSALAATRPYLEALASRGLLVTEAQQRARRIAATTACVFLLAVAGAKIGIALGRGRTNVWYLVLLAGACLWGCITWARHAMRTSAGANVLRDLRTLIGPRRARITASTLRDPEPGLLLLAAVGGITGGPFAAPRPAGSRDRSDGSSCGGASCGSGASCSGGSSCGGGGGGGGCGGCGA